MAEADHASRVTKSPSAPTGASAIPSWKIAVEEVVHSLPHRQQFVLMFVAWVALFHFLGNSVLGYVDTRSLFAWWTHVCWHSEEDQLCFLIPPLVVVLLWIRRPEWLAVEKHTSPWPLSLIAIGLLLHLTGFIAQQTRISILGFLIGLYGILGVVWGPRFLRRILYPYLLMGFAIPLGAVSDSLTSPLRLLVSVLSTGFANLILGLDVLRAGSLIYDSQGAFQYDVAPACSGIRSLTALVLLMTIYGFMTYRTVWRRALMIFLAIPLAILGNTLRLIIVIIAGEAFGQDAGVAVEQKLGFLTFALALVVILLLGHWLREPTEPAVESPSTPEPQRDGGAT